MLRPIKVYGSLAKFLGTRSFMADVKSPAEAVRFLIANFPGIEAHMSERHYKVSVGRFELEAGSEPEQLTYPVSGAEPIRIVPVLTGAGATGRIIAGVALIVLASVVTFGTVGGLFAAGAINAAITGVGVSLVIGGVASLLTPTPTQKAFGSDSINDPRKSYSFSGIQNVSRQGVPVPIVYGETIVGSVVLSAGINTEEVPT